MIIVKIVGGLGNQLFQYAFARSVSSHLKTNFRLDISPFNSGYKLHKYSLDYFNVKKSIARDSDFFGFVWIRKHSKIFDIFYKYIRLKSTILPFYYPEQMFHFDNSVFLKNKTYFDGFWQTEKYFKGIDFELRKEITLKNPLSTYSEEMLKKIKNSPSVSIHVRRGDYVTDQNTNIVHGTCSMEYYKKAIDHMTKKVAGSHFFIFSDDYDWSIENFKSLNHPFTCVKNDAEKNYEDLILMSNCKHNIIANSSFSWWGAWLNPNKEKIVIAPKKWFNTQKTTTNTEDIVPESWVKM